MRLHKSEAETPEDRLRADFDRATERVYPEEGIPMFLVCEDLAPNESSGEAAPFTLTSLNEDLASAFRRDAEAWPRIQPGAPAADACKIVEVLADRDFGAGRAEKNR